MKIKKIGKIFGANALALTFMVSVLSFSSITTFAEDIDKTGNTILTADEIEFDKVIAGGLNVMEEDWYTFSLAEPCEVDIVVASPVGFNTYDFQLLEEQNDYHVIDDLAIKRFTSWNKKYYLTAGKYYFGFKSDEYAKYCEEYEVKVTLKSIALSFKGEGENNAIGDSAVVELEKKYNAVISESDSIDYYTFELEKDGKVTFNLDAALDNCDWSLYDNQKDLIKHGTYQKDNENDSKITKDKALVLKAGKYYISLSANEKAPSYGSYTFSFNYLEKYNDIAVNGIIPFGDLNNNGKVDSSDASLILSYYAYLSTGGKETDMNIWIEDNFGTDDKSKS